MKLTRDERKVRRVYRLDIEKRWTVAHSAGKVHQFERSRILDGDYGPIIRELKPAFEEGKRCILSWSQPRGALVRDRATGQEWFYPKPPPEPMFWITIRDIVRHKNGYWRVRFHVDDRRDVVRLVRRMPPAVPFGADVPQATEEEARIESAYTSNPLQAVDPPEAVPPEYDNVLQMNADTRWQEHEDETRRAEVNKRQVRTIAQIAREYSIEAGKMGQDPTVVLAEVERMIASRMGELERAA